ncbi:MAG TPA: exopolyphosphatase, partial [Polyangia bacterium]|nr:exopolyphosphatase [Polyangia bacterium]
RNSMTVRLAGLDVPEKAALVTQLARAAVGDCEARLLRGDHADPADNDAAMALLTLTAKSPNKTRVGKAWAGKLVELALSSVPGHSITQPPSDATPYLVYWPALVDASQLSPTVTLDGANGEERYPVVNSPPTEATRAPIVASKPAWDARLDGPTVRVPLGRVFGSRSGDKGGNANLGLWSKTTLAYTWLEHYLTVDEMRTLFSDLAPYPMTRTSLPNLNAVHFYIHGLLGEGVASSTRSDPQAKTLGEYVRARVVAMPAVLLS